MFPNKSQLPNKCIFEELPFQVSTRHFQHSRVHRKILFSCIIILFRMHKDKESRRLWKSRTLWNNNTIFLTVDVCWSENMPGRCARCYFYERDNPLLFERFDFSCEFFNLSLLVAISFAAPSRDTYGYHNKCD